MLNLTDEYHSLTNSTQNIDDENDKVTIILELLVFSIPRGVLFYLS